MMSRYDVYKDSGIEWIGEIPEHWDVIKSKFLFGSRNERNNITEPLLSVTQKDSVVRRDELATRVWNPDSDISAYKLVKNGDFVISLRTFEGGIELSNVQGLVSPAYTVLYRKKEIEALYYKYLLKSARFITELNKITTGIRQGKNISFEDFAEILLPVPGLMDQKIIGAQLDEKTSLIDKLIEVKQRKIELLKEKRTALINHVVTKGLDPIVKMKESGIEWIGEIPEHWDYKKITHCFNLIGSGTTPSSTTSEYYENGKINWLQTGDLTDGIITRTSKLITQKAFDDLNLKIYPSNSLIIAMYGATIGKVGLLKIDTTTNQACCVLADPKGVYVNYVFYWFIANKDRVVSLGYGGGQPNISQETIKSLRIHCPPTEEQTQIVEYLDEKTKEVDNLLTLEQKKIDLLKEYRQTLISEVVTGKIKVVKDDYSIQQLEHEV